MKVIYSGKTKEFTPELEEKVTAKLTKLSKFVEQRGERELHLTHQVERHLHKIKLSMNFYDHGLVGEGADADLPTAVNHAIEKLEKQLVEARQRWRDTHRDAKTVRSSKEDWDNNTGPLNTPPPQPTGKSRANGNGRKPKVFRVNYTEDRKPMTLEEAMLEIERDGDYVVYRDSSRNCLSVLVRRADGNFDLIES
ncbi:MAG TPA: ribosome-associated translation inhibitor RaiA [Bryobacteraceae bacterium]|nr:ribosome-associated translation inhibitor RaiA [Bryobacteraceae bacterium]